MYLFNSKPLDISFITHKLRKNTYNDIKVSVVFDLSVISEPANLGQGFGLASGLAHEQE